VRDAGRDVWTVSPEPAAERADLAPVTVTITDYREVLTHPATARTADALLREVLMRGRHLGYVIDLGVDLATDPTALEWLRLLPIAGTVKHTVPAAAGWSLLRSDPAAAADLASHAAEAVMVPSQAATTRPSSPNPDNKGSRTARRVDDCLLSNAGWVPGMAAVKGRQQRTGVADAVFLGVRVSPANFAKLDRAAAALGISKAALVDALLSREEVDDQGRPLGWNSPVPTDQEELPLKSA
jgi:hypothetical protein